MGIKQGWGGIDTYGVNHNNFSLRDELEYQFARQKRENQLMQQYNNQGITENYPQFIEKYSNQELKFISDICWQNIQKMI